MKSNPLKFHNTTEYKVYLNCFVDRIAYYYYPFLSAVSYSCSVLYVCSFMYIDNLLIILFANIKSSIWYLQTTLGQTKALSILIDIPKLHQLIPIIRSLFPIYQCFKKAYLPMLQEEDGSKPDVTITEYIYLFAPALFRWSIVCVYYVCVRSTNARRTRPHLFFGILSTLRWWWYILILYHA